MMSLRARVEGILLEHGGQLGVSELVRILGARGYHKLGLLEVLPKLCHVEDDVATLFALVHVAVELKALREA